MKFRFCRFLLLNVNRFLDETLINPLDGILSNFSMQSLPFCFDGICERQETLRKIHSKIFDFP